ncbi:MULTISPECIES: alanine--tRNA ligase [Pseudanabaena]|uniref:Alanine--tRNA ligase n=2 Tax=Pseudanabaena TaxID=1152 RepID=L8MZ06_9CYAN|nr:MULTISPECIES: alanine--tRNA ligase [Pseudanabaena]ELS31203.1 alanyl-tRNA synthetase [Pseudanabaena biceps PCC 7429]MDG3496539.1 alanine--tRNA ligase [Pseudanabaena catenata USMAC16]
MASLPSLTGAEIRSKFLRFFEERDHKVLPSASLVPADPTVLLTIAGMLPFKPIFLGQQEAEVPRATTSQKCIRTNDIENVGRTARHHTFFEMLGNFSFGDYFKKEAIAWGWELVTKVFQLPPDRLVVSVYHTDEDAFAIWRDAIGIPAHRIQRMGDDNFWASGATGPCGPCSEIYFDFHPELGDDAIDLEDDSRFLEIYNLVFMELNREADGSLTKLKKQNIDTGLGLERMAQVLQGVPNNYETDLIFPIVKKAADLAGLDYHQSDEKVKTSLKVIGDHVRSVVHMIADGINASNVGRGYVMRRLLRRVVRHGRLIGISGTFASEVAEVAIALSESVYPNTREREKVIKDEIQIEETRFLQTLERGEKLLVEILEKAASQSSKTISGVDAFTLYDTYGFPFELTQEIAEEEGFVVDAEGFDAEMKKQQERSQAAHEDIDLMAKDSWVNIAKEIGKTEFLGYKELSSSAQVKRILVNGESVKTAIAGNKVQIVLDRTPFYAESGGQVGDKGYLAIGEAIAQISDVQKQADLFVHIGQIERGEITVGDHVNAQIAVSDRRRIQAHHTATHLLQAALKKIVDPNVSQAGSLVDGDRLRFDFNLNRAVTAVEIQQIELQINNWIAEAHDSVIEVMPIAQAKAKGAIAMFGEKYGAEVRVMDIPNVSMELCGGTHVKNTSEIGLFKIISEAGVASGVRRIEAIAGQAVLEYLTVRDNIAKDLSDRFKIKPEEISDRITGLQQELKNAHKEVETLKQELALVKADTLIHEAEAVGSFKILVAQLPDIEAEALKAAAEKLSAKLGHSAVVLGSFSPDGKVTLVACFSKEVIAKGLQAGKFVGAIAKICGGGGGGRPNVAQAGGKDASKLPEALEVAETQLRQVLSNS